MILRLSNSDVGRQVTKDCYHSEAGGKTGEGKWVETQGYCRHSSGDFGDVDHHAEFYCDLFHRNY